MSDAKEISIADLIDENKGLVAEIDKLKKQIEEKNKTETIKYSEFGKGFTYCIGLFLCHAEREGQDNYWFNGAADHLFELQIPEILPFKDEVAKWQEKCLRYRCEEYKKDEIMIAVNEAKIFLLRYDEFMCISTMKAEWS